MATVVRCVAAGMTTPEILAAHPDLEAEDVKAALEHAALLAEDRVIPLTA